jgi:RimJ/RimL family protein N-acetyltransferase
VLPIGLTCRMDVLSIRTERLVLRVMRPGDAPIFAAYRDDPDVARFQDWPMPFTLADADRMLAGQAHLDDLDPEGWTQVAIEHDGEVIGDLGVCLQTSEHRAMLGYTIAPSAQHRGIAVEAAGAMIDAVFERTETWRVVATVDDANTASMRVIESLGFRFEGIARRGAMVRGEWVDDVQFAITRDDRTAWLSRMRTRPKKLELIELVHETAGPYAELVTHRYQEEFVAPMSATFRHAGGGRGAGSAVVSGHRRRRRTSGIRDARARDRVVPRAVPVALPDRPPAPTARHRHTGDVDADRPAT